MFKFRQRIKSDPMPATSFGNAGQQCAAALANTDFIATFDANLSANSSANSSSGIYRIHSENGFAVLCDEIEARLEEITSNENIRSARRANSIPGVIAVMRDADGQVRFFHPEESRRADRPVWRPLQRVQS